MVWSGVKYEDDEENVKPDKKAIDHELMRVVKRLVSAKNILAVYNYFVDSFYVLISSQGNNAEIILHHFYCAIWRVYLLFDFCISFFIFRKRWLGLWIWSVNLRRRRILLDQMKRLLGIVLL